MRKYNDVEGLRQPPLQWSTLIKTVAFMSVGWVSMHLKIKSFLIKLRPLVSTIFFKMPFALQRFAYLLIGPQLFKKNIAIGTADSISLCGEFRKFHCIFVHVPKTAGMSVSQGLFGRLSGGHMPIRCHRVIFGQRRFSEYFKFAFVRNPWERVFSAYNFLKQGGMNGLDDEWAKNTLSKYACFEDFVEGWLSESNVMKWIHFIPQHHFLCLPGCDELLVDFLGYYENLSSDYEYIRRKLNIGIPLPKINSSSTSNLSYRSQYRAAGREIVGKVYAKDIALFGYSFDNSSLAAQIKNRARYDMKEIRND